MNRLKGKNEVKIDEYLAIGGMSARDGANIENSNWGLGDSL